MNKCQFHLYDKFHNGFDDTEECNEEGIKNYAFLGDMRVVHLCSNHFDIIDQQIERGNKK